MGTRKSNIHKRHQTRKSGKKNGKKNGKKSGNKSKKKTFKNLKCSPMRNNKNKRFSCYDSEALYKIRNAWNIRHSDSIIDTDNPKEIWESLKELNSKTCSNEMCWIKQQCMKHDLDKNLVLDNFAPIVPKEWFKKENEWLSSIEIMQIMKQWEKKNPQFVFLGPSPIDYDKHLAYDECVWEDLCKFSLINMIKKGKTKIGIIFNTHPHTEDGEHWICCFIDIKKEKIYYFDSYGDRIPTRIRKFVRTIEEQSEKIGNKYEYLFNKKRHQYSMSECGMYCLYVIVELCKGSPWSKVSEKRIDDKYMKKLRKIYFNHIKI